MAIVAGCSGGSSTTDYHAVPASEGNPAGRKCKSGGGEQRKLVAVSARLRIDFRGRYAGRRILCDPLEIQVLLKGDAGVAAHSIETPLGTARVTYHPGAAYTVKEMSEVMAAGNLERWFPGSKGMYTDMVYGRGVIRADTALKVDQFQTMLPEAERSLGIPLAIQRVDKVHDSAPRSGALEDEFLME